MIHRYHVVVGGCVLILHASTPFLQLCLCFVFSHADIVQRSFVLLSRPRRSNMAAPAVPTKTERRSQRQRAVKMFNVLAGEIDADPLNARPSGADVDELFKHLCTMLPAHSHENLKDARNIWVDNGGEGELCEDLLPVEELFFAPDGPDALPKHMTLGDASGKAFRLRSRAFMLTFHSVQFVGGVLLWMEFHTWVKERLQRFGATHYSCTLEESVASGSEKRCHAHCYFSWHGSNNGIDHSTTKEWRFRDIAPRVDKNTENRGPWHWQRAVQHGHFYVSIIKEGTLHSATDYGPWEGQWIPEAAWVVSLWKQHKLSHSTYLALSVKLRDGHDRRKACVESVIAAESAVAYANERAEARALLAKTAKLFKPLPDAIQIWKLQYDQAKERYLFLVLFGPSCTGKSRLARRSSLVGGSGTPCKGCRSSNGPGTPFGGSALALRN